MLLAWTRFLLVILIRVATNGEPFTNMLRIFECCFSRPTGSLKALITVSK